MSYACEICEKKSQRGRSQQHLRGVAGKRWKKRAQSTIRTFRPNLQRKTLTIKGETKQMRICTKCLKAIKKFGKVKGYKNVLVA